MQEFGLTPKPNSLFWTILKQILRLGRWKASVEKSVSSKDYKLFLRVLRAERRRLGVTQSELGRRLHETQTFVSKFERGERRIDVVELRAICRAMGISFAAFVRTSTQV